jgi:hypothetical protein
VVKSTRGEEQVSIEGVPAEEGVDTADAVERIDLDPDEQRNFPETHPDDDEKRKM